MNDSHVIHTQPSRTLSRERLLQVNWYKYYGPHFVVFNSGGYLREHNLPAPLPKDVMDRNLPVDGEEALAFKLREEYGPRSTQSLRDLPVEDHGYSLKSGKQWRGDIVTYIDKMVGRLIAKLDQEGLRNDTLIVFTSDNGPGTDGAVSPGVERLPGSKGGVLDGATRVPCLISWPAVIRPGSTHHGLVDFSDFLPTFVELVGGELPAGTRINGISFAELLRGRKGESREWIYIHDGWHPNPASQELYDGQSWSDKPKTPKGQPLVPRVNPPYTHIKAFRYVRGLHYKLYSDGRFYDLDNDLHERQPIPPGDGSREAEQARAALQQALAKFPKKK